MKKSLRYKIKKAKSCLIMFNFFEKTEILRTWNLNGPFLFKKGKEMSGKKEKTKKRNLCIVHVKYWMKKAN